MEVVYARIAQQRIAQQRICRAWSERHRIRQPLREWQLLEPDSIEFQLLPRIRRNKPQRLFPPSTQYAAAHRAAARVGRLWRQPRQRRFAQRAKQRWKSRLRFRRRTFGRRRWWRTSLGRTITLGVRAASQSPAQVELGRGTAEIKNRLRAAQSPPSTTPRI